MNKYLKIFFKNSIISGVIIGLIMLIIEMGNTELGGLMSGILPLGFIYIVICIFLSKLNNNDKIEKITKFSKYAMIGGLFFVFIIISFYYTIKSTKNILFAFGSLLAAAIISVLFIFNYITLS